MVITFIQIKFKLIARLKQWHRLRKGHTGTVDLDTDFSKGYNRRRKIIRM